MLTTFLTKDSDTASQQVSPDFTRLCVNTRKPRAIRGTATKQSRLNQIFPQNAQSFLSADYPQIPTLSKGHTALIAEQHIFSHARLVLAFYALLGTMPNSLNTILVSGHDFYAG